MLQSAKYRPDIPNISPSVRQGLPQALQDILDDEECESPDEDGGLWTPVMESKYQAQVASLSGKLLFVKRVAIDLPIPVCQGKLEAFVETSISADFKVAKASELLKMVSEMKNEAAIITLSQSTPVSKIQGATGKPRGDPKVLESQGW